MTKSSGNKGFTLLEAMIVLVVVGVVAAISLDMLTGQARAEARRQMVSQQATEMATINRAVTEWASTASGLPTTAGQIQEVNLADVITAGRLPERFARRPAAGTNNPVSPIGQPYRAFVRRTTAGGYEVVVVPLGAINSGFAARAGIQTSGESLRTWNVAVMQQVREKHTLPSGVVAENTARVDDALSGFQLDLAGFLGANVSVPTVAAMGGFSSLAATQALPTSPSAGGGDYIGRSCRITSNQECLSSEETAISYVVCARWGADFRSTTPQSEVIITPLGNMSISRGVSNNSTAFPLDTAVATAPMAPSVTSVFNSPAYFPGGEWFDVVDPDAMAFNCTNPYSGATFGCAYIGGGGSFDPQVLRQGAAPPLAVTASIRPPNPSPFNIIPTPSSWTYTRNTLTFNSITTEIVGTAAPCSGSRKAVPLPFYQGTVRTTGYGTVLDPKWGGSIPQNLGIVSGEFLQPNGSMPALIASLQHSQRVDRLTYTEGVFGPNVSVSVACEITVISNAATVPVPSGLPNPDPQTGTNTCPLNSAWGNRRPYQAYSFRNVAGSAQTIRMCCSR